LREGYRISEQQNRNQKGFSEISTLHRRGFSLVKLEEMDTKERMKKFRESLLSTLNPERIDELNEWAHMGEKITAGILLGIGLLSYIFELGFGIELFSAIVGFFLLVIFDVLFRHSKLRKAFDYKILLVALSIFGLWYGFSYGLLIIAGFYFRDVPIVLLPWAIVVMIVSYIVWVKTRSFLDIRISSAVIEDMAPFRKTIVKQASRYISKARLNSSVIASCILIPSVIYLVQPPENPIAVILLSTFLIISLLSFLDLLRIDKYSESLDILWDVGSIWVTDLMTHCVFLKKRFTELGITDYQVVERYKPCWSTSDLPDSNPSDFISSQIYIPKGFSPAILLKISGSEADDLKVRNTVDEEWNEVTIIGANSTLPVTPPLYFPNARVLADEPVIEKDFVAWVSGRPCFGIIFKGSDIKKLCNYIGHFTK
jgi:hypothetical protein